MLEIQSSLPFLILKNFSIWFFALPNKATFHRRCHPIDVLRSTLEHQLCARIFIKLWALFLNLATGVDLNEVEVASPAEVMVTWRSYECTRVVVLIFKGRTWVELIFNSSPVTDRQCCCTVLDLIRKLIAELEEGLRMKEEKKGEENFLTWLYNAVAHVMRDTKWQSIFFSIS